jgi:dynein heavy chain
MQWLTVSGVCGISGAAAGEIGFSAALEELSSSLFHGKLPPAWARLNPATEKALGPWMAWFTRRHEQYKVSPEHTLDYP